MTDWLAIIILGIIEGITEFLPISSTAHLLIAEKWLPRQSDLFNIVIQSGAVIAVLPLWESYRTKTLLMGLAVDREVIGYWLLVIGAGSLMYVDSRHGTIAPANAFVSPSHTLS